jgi:hypothetical protein
VTIHESGSLDVDKWEWNIESKYDFALRHDTNITMYCEGCGATIDTNKVFNQSVTLRRAD